MSERPAGQKGAMARVRPHIALVGLGLVMFVAARTLAQAPPARALKVNFFSNISDGKFGDLYLMSGGGRHTLVMGTEDRVVVIDTKRDAGWGAPMLDWVRKVSDAPVTTLINTNANSAGSNAEFPEATHIVAHERTKARLATMPAFQGAGARFLPNATFADRFSIDVKTVGEAKGTNRVDLIHLGPGSTDGDVIVVLPMLGIVFTGDLFPGKLVPRVDLTKGGSLATLPDTLDRLLETLKGIQGLQMVVPGEGPPPPDTILGKWLTVKDVQEYAAFVRDFVAEGRAARGAGKDAQGAAAGLSLAARYPGYDLTRASEAMAVLFRELQ